MKTWSVGYKSIDEGLDELQRFYLRQELLKDHGRSVNIIRAVAKSKALKTRIKWVLKEAMVVTGIFMVIIFVAVAFIIMSL